MLGGVAWLLTGPIKPSFCCQERLHFPRQPHLLLATYDSWPRMQFTYTYVCIYVQKTMFSSQGRHSSAGLIRRFLHHHHEVDESPHTVPPVQLLFEAKISDENWKSNDESEPAAEPTNSDICQTKSLGHPPTLFALKEICLNMHIWHRKEIN